ncbi:hypothetical protein CEXT_241681 [Caerostris extrusa]|uniref:Uncharacterized protein n=1 Tax=Caerostris extrusa TaxID=172846 RepID=A0AAV4TG62_CAEEX|nr:hypothetical protein CEXT_241681 [Caerostris extrusa]
MIDSITCTTAQGLLFQILPREKVNETVIILSLFHFESNLFAKHSVSQLFPSSKIEDPVVSETLCTGGQRTVHRIVWTQQRTSEKRNTNA